MTCTFMNIQSVVIFPFGETGNDIFNSLTGVLEEVVKPAFLTRLQLQHCTMELMNSRGAFCLPR